MHTHGEQFRNIPAEQTFTGQSLPRHATAIKQLIDLHQARTLLDYGCGKGQQYTQVKVKLPDGRQYGSIPAWWGVNTLICYDPGYEPFQKLPGEACDGVLCTDVLEHCPKEDLPWIVEELFAFARKFVFANVACYPARKRLSNGENAHCTIEPPAWWSHSIAGVAQRHPHVRYHFLLDQFETAQGGSSHMTTAMIEG